MKRIFDIVCASILIILSLPVMADAALFIVAEDGFPLLYRQERVGLNGRLFNVISSAACAAMPKRMASRSGHRPGQPRDPHRPDHPETAHDELPQLFSVLKGDMSLVGPRPSARSLSTN